jgi:hypothetical protein
MYTLTERQKDEAQGKLVPVLIPWPADALGEYGVNESTDEDLDLWVEAHFDSQDTIVKGICPGDHQNRDRSLHPVVIVTVTHKDVSTAMDESSYPKPREQRWYPGRARETWAQKA